MKPVITYREAKAQGLKYYFTGVRCKRGHLSEYYVSRQQCRQCVAESVSEKRKRKRVVKYPLDVAGLNWNSLRDTPPMNTPLLLKLSTGVKAFPFELISSIRIPTGYVTLGLSLSELPSIPQSRIEGWTLIKV